MRILQVSSAKTFGGGERHLVDLVRSLQDRGHEIFLALRPSSNWQDKFDFLPTGHILHTSIRNSFGIFSAKRIAGFVNQNKIEIIHAHVARDYLPVSLACRIARKTKFVITRHVVFPMKPFHRFALKNLSRAIAVSAVVGENLQTIFTKEKIKIIPNGIETENWSAAHREQLRKEFRFLHNIPFDTFLIGTVGELKELKGQRDFVLAAHEIAKKFPEVRFIIVGKDHSANQSFRRELKRLVKVFELKDRVLFLDWVEETAPLMAALDIFVSASHSESFGLAILEAMAGGTPIVATETDGAKELLQNDETGLLIPIKNAVHLANAVENLLQDAEKCRKFGEKTQIFARQNFSLERMVEETEKIYREILSA